MAKRINKFKTPKASLVDRDFQKLNYDIFHNELPEFDDIIVKNLGKNWGICSQLGFQDSDEIEFLLELDNYFNDYNQYLSVLGHEMVHLHQMINGDTAKHNKWFYSFRPAFESYGLILTREY